MVTIPAERKIALFFRDGEGKEKRERQREREREGEREIERACVKERENMVLFPFSVTEWWLQWMVYLPSLSGNVQQRFRGGLVFKAHRLLYHPTLGLRVSVPTKRRGLVCATCACLRNGGGYRGTSLTRKRTPLRPYRRPIPRVLGGPRGMGAFYGRGTPVEVCAHKKTPQVFPLMAWNGSNCQLQMARVKVLNTLDRLRVGWLNGLSFIWQGCRESRRCSRDTYPKSYITKYTSIRRSSCWRKWLE